MHAEGPKMTEITVLPRSPGVRWLTFGRLPSPKNPDPNPCGLEPPLKNVDFLVSETSFKCVSRVLDPPFFVF